MAIPNLWNNIQIVRICIFKYNIFNSVSFVTRYLDIKTSYNYFGHISDEVIYYILDNVKNVKKIYFPVQKYIYHYYTFGKIYQYNLSKNVMGHLNTNNFIFLFFYFSDFILILFSLFFSFSFGQWRGIWHHSHMTGHMMWRHRPKTWWKDLEDDLRAHIYNMVALSKMWGRHESVAWTIGQA